MADSMTRRGGLRSPPWPRVAAVILGTLIAIAFGTFAPAVRGDIVAEDKGSSEGSSEPEFLARELEGPDPEVAALHAHRLLQSIASKDAGMRLKSLNYILEKLDPARLTHPSADIVTASRIVDAMATWIKSSGPPFPKSSEVLLPVVGVGPPQLREAVIRAFHAVVRHELAAGRPSPTGEVLAARFAESPGPPEPFIRDAARILWETDGKALLGALVGAIGRVEGAPGAGGASHPALCLEELRSRIPVDFPNLDGWKKWWDASHDLPLERILGEAQQRFRDEHVSSWRHLIRRLRETGDPERLLLAIEDTLAGVYSPELRTAAVMALGDFAGWLLEARVAEPRAAERVEDDDPKARLLSKAVHLLAALFEAKDFYLERKEVLRAALVSLAKYHLFLEKRPPLLAKVAGITVHRLQGLLADDRSRHRDELLETIRLAGALRIPDALGMVEALIREPSPPLEEDLDLLTTAVNTLGRLADKGIGPQTAALLIGQSKKPRGGSEKSVRELRKACIAALATGSEDPAVRAELLGFFRDVLHSASDKDLRIPILLGLGTLARQKEAGAFECLAQVLGGVEEFESREVIAAIDSIAYVGGDAALSTFVSCLPRGKEKDVEEHLVMKIGGLIKAGGHASLAQALEKLEEAAIEDDSQRPLDLLVSIASLPESKDLLSPVKLDPGRDAAVLDAWWRASTSLARAQDALGKEEELAASIASLNDSLLKDRGLKEKVPRAASDISELKSAASERAPVLSRLLGSEPNGNEPGVEDLARLASPEKSVPARWRALRWIHRQLASAAPEVRSRLGGLWHAHLTSDEARGIWEGFPARCRDRIIEKVDLLRK